MSTLDITQRKPLRQSQDTGENRGKAIYYLKYPREGWNLGGGRWEKEEGRVTMGGGITHLCYYILCNQVHPWFAISKYVFCISIQYDYIALNIF